MSTITITSTNVRLVRAGAGEHQHTAPLLEALTAGQYGRLDPTTGKFALGNASSAGEVGEGYLFVQTGAVGETLTGYQGPALIDLGDALAGLNFGDKVYLSDTDGTLQTTAGTVSTVVGSVVPGFATTTAEKLLKLELG